ncbi:beta-galactosidase 13-like [Mercurialis annua]|uniref:beta-galactosidase 13-like n=1 Tax=Mercurialis annua TaxID=3986 RepID=UPI00215E553D|nr:beta-galactosidase 13-like [Mercurialis annua]
MNILILIFSAFFSVLAASETANHHHSGVRFDQKSLIINGKRELLISGSVHYTRSTPDMWSGILMKARRGGLNVIQTYVFWNVHEPVQGRYNFEGQYDVVKFVKMIGAHGMYATLRIGPFIEAEWNHGGFPYWLREISNITFRTDNPPFKHYMEKFVTMIVKKMKEEKLFASQGGPIILSQIENEYKSVELSFRESGRRYVEWAGNMAVGLNTGVPWIMCKQNDAPDSVISTCNGRHCGDTFTGPNATNKPSLWTENWTAKYRVFGNPPSERSVEDLAYSVARWFSKNGSLVNYYMYHGGTNFGRTSSSFVTTSYYDEAPLDEYGLRREPKWGHLKDLHSALRMCKKALFWGIPRIEQLSEDIEARIFEKAGTEICVAFLTNNNTRHPTSINFRGRHYYLPSHSISILPDCKTVVYNTKKIVSQHNARSYIRSEVANKNLTWKMYKERIPEQLKLKSKKPLELYELTKDTSDYAWYSTVVELNRRDLQMRKDIGHVLRVASLGHAMLAFVNGKFVGAAHGNNIEKSFVLQKSVNLKPGNNTITLLGSLMGFPDSGAYMEHKRAGPHGVSLLGLNKGTLDLSSNGWGHQVGLEGEKQRLYSVNGSRKLTWTNVNTEGPALMWYKTYFDAPEGRDPVAVRMNGMGKGMIWINGKSIGRYWMSFLSPLGHPTQSEYHIPRSYLNSTKNLMVILEEEEANLEKIEILTVNRDTVCSYTEENGAGGVKSWARKNRKILPVVDNVKPAAASLKCPNKKKIVAVEFASFGNPYGVCGGFVAGNCSVPASKQVIEQNCLGRRSCNIPISRHIFEKRRDICSDLHNKILAVQVKCGNY